MAGDWIKMRVLIARDPKVIAIADHLAGQREFMDWLTAPLKTTCNHSAYERVTRCVTVSVTVSALLVVWGVANESGKADGDDLLLGNASLWTLDEVAGVPGFGDAMSAAGWAVEEDVENGDTQVRFPKFMLHNIPAEDRKKQENAARQRKWRGKRKCDNRVTGRVTERVTNGVTGRVTNNANSNTTLQNITEQYSNTPLPPLGALELPANLKHADFETAWTEWVRYRKERRHALTPSTAEKQLKKLSAWGREKAIAAIHRSITQGWLGLFESGDGNAGSRAGVGRARIAAEPGKYDGVGETVSGEIDPAGKAGRAPPAGRGPVDHGNKRSGSGEDPLFAGR